MSLADLIRKKSDLDVDKDNLANFANGGLADGETLAGLATLSLENSPEPFSAQEEATIGAWLEYIGETDPEEIARVWERCRNRTDARAFVLRLAAKMPATASPAGRVAIPEAAMGHPRTPVAKAVPGALRRVAPATASPGRCVRCDGEGCQWCKPRVAP